MRYEVRKLKYCVKLWKDKNRRRWPYLTEKEAEVQGIDLNNVFADVGSEKDYNGDCLFYAGRKLVLTDKREELKKKRENIRLYPMYGQVWRRRICSYCKETQKMACIIIAFIIAYSTIVWGEIFY